MMYKVNRLTSRAVNHKKGGDFVIINDATPIFIQIKEQIKDDIMSGVYEVDELIISTT